jgi:HD-GYP domain-containing protein (c-di-GMP phosphodiesterase class II)
MNRIYQVLDLKRQEDYIYQHCVNVAIFSLMVGQKLRFNDKKLMSLVTSALLHDFGMLFIEPEIINKTTRLSDGEFEIVKEHTVKGFTHLVRNCSFDGLSTIASVQHHERFDGKGYPNSIDGEKIHEFARIIAVTDAFDAWTSDRPHRRMNSVEEAIAFLKAHDGDIFDPQVVKSFIEIF